MKKKRLSKKAAETVKRRMSAAQKLFDKRFQTVNDFVKQYPELIHELIKASGCQPEIIVYLRGDQVSAISSTIDARTTVIDWTNVEAGDGIVRGGWPLDVVTPKRMDQDFLKQKYELVEIIVKAKKEHNDDSVISEDHKEEVKEFVVAFLTNDIPTASKIADTKGMQLLNNIKELFPELYGQALFPG